MALLVDEVMNHELFSVSPETRAGDAIGYLLALGISTCPVIDADDRGVGMIALRDLLGAHDVEGQSVVADSMTRPLATIPAGATIAEAAQRLGETGYHHLVAVDESDAPVGMVSTLDVIRGLIGMPAGHPSTFPHYDRVFGVTWSDDARLTAERVSAAPAARGVLALIAGGAGRRERIVWAELTGNLRARLRALLFEPAEQPTVLHYWLEIGDLRFRVAELADSELGRRLVDALQRRAGYARE